MVIFTREGKYETIAEVCDFLLDQSKIRIKIEIRPKMGGFVHNKEKRANSLCPSLSPPEWFM